MHCRVHLEMFFICLPGILPRYMCIAGFNLQAVFICPPAFPKEVRRLPVMIWRPRRRTAFALDSFWRRGRALLQFVFCPGRFYFEPVFFGWAKVIWIRFPGRIAFVGCRYAFKALPAWCEPEAGMVFPGRSHRTVLPAFAAVCCKSGALFCNFITDSHFYPLQPAWFLGIMRVQPQPTPRKGTVTGGAKHLPERNEVATHTPQGDDHSLMAPACISSHAESTPRQGTTKAAALPRAAAFVRLSPMRNHAQRPGTDECLYRVY